MTKDERCFYMDIAIRFYDCDAFGRARLETLLRNAADIAGVAYTAKGYSHQWLWERGFVFLLSRVSMKIKRTPKSEEKLTLKTWERDVKGAQFIRDIVFYDESGEEIAFCSTAWILVNPQSRTILKPSAFTGTVDKHPELIAGCKPTSRLKLVLPPTISGEREIVYSDIDANGHVYNAVYGGIACDILPEEATARELDEFEINFKHEALLHDKLILSAAVCESAAEVSGTVGGETSFECRFGFK